MSNYELQSIDHPQWVRSTNKLQSIEVEIDNRVDI